MKSSSKSSHSSGLRPAKVHPFDVHTIKTVENRTLKESLLSQQEYNALKKYMRAHAHHGLKLSRKDNTIGLSKSVIFDEEGRAYVLFWGKSFNERIGQAGLPLQGGKARDDADEGKILGKGGFGRVKICQDIENGKWYAVKIVPTKGAKLPPKEISHQLYAESQGLKRLARFKGATQLGNGRRKHYLFQKLVHGQELADWIKSSALSTLSEEEQDLARLKVALNTIQAIAQCHRVGLLHRDVKLNNLLVHPISLEVTLVDFGFARQMGTGKEVFSDSLLGTAGYLAPEVKSDKYGQFRYTEATETFALGLVVGTLLFGRDFRTDYTLYQPKALKDFGFKMADFEEGGLRKSLKRSVGALDEPLEPGEPNRCPWVRFCQELATAPSAKQLQRLPIHMQPWAIIVGEMLSVYPENRPSMDRIQKLFKKLLRTREIETGQANPTIFERLTGKYHRSKSDKPKISLEKDKPAYTFGAKPN